MSGGAESFDRNRPRLDAMSLAELSAMFDERCEQARQRGLWLWEFEPEFCAYCLRRLPLLANKGAGMHRQ